VKSNEIVLNIIIAVLLVYWILVEETVGLKASMDNAIAQFT